MKICWIIGSVVTQKLFDNISETQKDSGGWIYSQLQYLINSSLIESICIISATDSYIRLFSIDMPVRFDIITIILGEKSFKIEHIEDAFFPPIW